MRIPVVRIGNSRGVRLPKPILEQCGIVGAVDLKVENRSVVLSPTISRPREGWAAAAARAAEAGDDEMLIPAALPDDEVLVW